MAGQVVGGEVDTGHGHVMRAGDFAQGDGLEDLTGGLGIAQVGTERGSGPTGTDDVDSSARGNLADLVFQAFSQAVDETGLGGGIIGMTGLAEETSGGADENSSGVEEAKTESTAKELAEAKENAGEVDLKGVVPAFEGEEMKRKVLLGPMTGIGDEDFNGP